MDATLRAAIEGRKYKGLRLQSVCYLVAIRTSARRKASTIRHGEGRGPVASPVFKPA